MVIQTFEEFAEVHGILLAASGIPQSLHRQLFHKLSTETFDAGLYFQVEPLDAGRQRRLVLTSDDSIQSESQLFLVDHAWTFRLSDAPKQVPNISYYIYTCAPTFLAWLFNFLIYDSFQFPLS